MLAERLGMTVAELGARMSSREIVEWQALDYIRSDEKLSARLRDEAEAGLIDQKRRRKAQRGR